MKIILLIIVVFAFLSYSDGIYSGKSQSHYTNEPYVGYINIEIKNDRIVRVNFAIIDTLKKDTVNNAYARHFAGNELYMQQTRNDSRGIQLYPQKLIEMQDIEKVDAISGATWSYNIFKASVKTALKNKSYK